MWVITDTAAGAPATLTFDDSQLPPQPRRFCRPPAIGGEIVGGRPDRHGQVRFDGDSSPPARRATIVAIYVANGMAVNTSTPGTVTTSGLSDPGTTPMDLTVNNGTTTNVNISKVGRHHPRHRRW